MQVNSSVKFANGSDLYLLEQILPKHLVDGLLTVFQDSINWQPLEQFAHTPGRLGYTGTGTVPEQLREYFSSEQFVQEVSSILGYPVRFLDYSMWLDRSGFTMSAHRDLDLYGNALQIYIADPTVESLHPPQGTVFFTDQQRPVFEIAYRSNTGYLINKTYTLTHGLTRPVEQVRYSVYVRLEPC